MRLSRSRLVPSQRAGGRLGAHSGAPPSASDAVHMRAAARTRVQKSTPVRINLTSVSKPASGTKPSRLTRILSVGARSWVRNTPPK